ncbi:hypothetical protein NO1_0572 [Candidatus Termititenax aidoneus]|uniref:Uncharacterized protein n=1 Tax=Termititenax aidoneus TaxID=2218524 RepID=A0A388TA52_TERA1|nr:hypothetical protein NO1_0572 [Candidatus Termititenax aidoneus]
MKKNKTREATNQAERERVAKRCFDATKKIRGRNDITWKSQYPETKAKWLPYADFHIAELKKARLEIAKRVMFANSNGKHFIISDLHGCPSRKCNISKCCNNFVAEAKKIIKENKL